MGGIAAIGKVSKVFNKIVFFLKILIVTSSIFLIYFLGNLIFPTVAQPLKAVGAIIIAITIDFLFVFLFKKIRNQ